MSKVGQAGMMSMIGYEIGSNSKANTERTEVIVKIDKSILKSEDADHHILIIVLVLVALIVFMMLIALKMFSNNCQRRAVANDARI